MSELQAAVDVEVPLDRVWAAVVDWESQGSWIVATTVHRTQGDGSAVGDRVEAVTGVGWFGFRDPMVITAWRPPCRCLVRHEGRLLRGAGSFEVLPNRAGNGARVVWTEWVQPPFGLLGELGALLVRPLSELMLSVSLRRLARRCLAG